MNNIKKVLVAAGAMIALGAQANGTTYPEEPAGAAAGYNQFTTDLGVFCGAAQPFSGVGEPTWACSGGVDQGVTVGPIPPAPIGTKD